jgi:hypothetical protein
VIRDSGLGIRGSGVAASAAGDAEHEGEQTGHRRHLPDPEEERPPQNLDADGRELLTDGTKPLVQLHANRGDFFRHATLESIGRDAQHAIAPCSSFQLEQFQEAKRGLVAETISEWLRHSIRLHRSTLSKGLTSLDDDAIVVVTCQ